MLFYTQKHLFIVITHAKYAIYQVYEYFRLQKVYCVVYSNFGFRLFKLWIISSKSYYYIIEFQAYIIPTCYILIYEKGLGLVWLGLASNRLS